MSASAAKSTSIATARRDVFDYIEMFYNSKRRHGDNNGLSPIAFEQQHFNTLASV